MTEINIKLKFLSLGIPHILNQDEEGEQQILVDQTIGEEVDRTRRDGFRDPGASPYIIPQEHMDSLRRRHQFLDNYDERLIAATPLDTLIKLEATSIKFENLKKARDCADGLQQNRDQMDSTYYHIAKGKENRGTKLHSMRFLPGIFCSAPQT